MGELLWTNFAPMRWIVPQFIPEGLILLVGKPKIGKSWMMLQTALAVAQGGSIFNEQCQLGTVHYFALEDNARRLKERGAKLQASPIAQLQVTFEMPRLDTGGLDWLNDWLAQHPETRLIMIDTFTMVRPTRGRNDTQLAPRSKLSFKSITTLCLFARQTNHGFS
jgi:predicted ATP-dependent serine protease